LQYATNQWSKRHCTLSTFCLLPCCPRAQTNKMLYCPEPNKYIQAEPVYPSTCQVACALHAGHVHCVDTLDLLVWLWCLGRTLKRQTCGTQNYVDMQDLSHVGWRRRGPHGALAAEKPVSWKLGWAPIFCSCSWPWAHAQSHITWTCVCFLRLLGLSCSGLWGLSDWLCSLWVT
jgi:hypothetical protein